MGEYIDKIYKRAEREIVNVIEDDERWNLFLKQLGQQGMDFCDNKLREQARSPGKERELLAILYKIHSLTHICDSCDYNPHRRRGYKKFSKKKVFDCDCYIGDSYDRTQPPKWLDNERNLCPEYYIDLTRP